MSWIDVIKKRPCWIVAGVLGIIVFYGAVSAAAWCTAGIPSDTLKSWVTAAGGLLLALLKLVKDLADTDFDKKGFPSRHKNWYLAIVVAYNAALFAAAFVALIILL